MKIRNFIHKPLRRLYADGTTRGLPSDVIDKLRKILAFLDAMENVEALKSLPSLKAHVLTGDRRGTWRLTVTRNWRLTFTVDSKENEICNVNYEDYH